MPTSLPTPSRRMHSSASQTLRTILVKGAQSPTKVARFTPSAVVISQRVSGPSMQVTVTCWWIPGLRDPRSSPERFTTKATASAVPRRVRMVEFIPFLATTRKCYGATIQRPMSGRRLLQPLSPSVTVVSSFTVAAISSTLSKAMARRLSGVTRSRKTVGWTAQPSLFRPTRVLHLPTTEIDSSTHSPARVSNRFGATISPPTLGLQPGTHPLS